MNFLGHFYLSGDSEDLIVGNFIADFVKGKRFMDYPKGISRGITMHRHIDAYTDAHASFRESRKRLRPKYRHYAGVIVDMFYDHFLASNWHLYSDRTLENYAGDIYDIIESRWHVLPPKSQVVFPYMRRGNWLVRYAQPEGIHLSLRGMAQRTKFDSKMDQAIDDLHNHYDGLMDEFNGFIKDIAREFKVS